jgi:Acetyltransferase (GNAT) domain
MPIVRSNPAFLTPHPECSDESLNSPCYFLDEAWLVPYIKEWDQGCFYGHWHSSPHLSRAQAVLSCGIKTSRLGIKYRSIGFNEATEALLENLTLEFNGFLVSSDSAPTSTAMSEEASWSQNFLDDLLEYEDWDEIRLNALNNVFAERISEFSRDRGLIATLVGERKTYWTDLDQVRQKFQGDFLKSVSSNTRSQLRRARKSTETALGALALVEPVTLEEAHLWFEELGELHQARWNVNKNIIGFSNPRFVNFHRETINRLWPNGQLQLLKLSAGDTTLAYLYNFMVGGHTYFVMSGIAYDKPQAAKPGLLAHWFAIEHNLTMGSRIYDFLAGTHQYKQSLSTHVTNQSSLTIRRPRLHFKLENWLRNMKRRNLP